VVPAVGAVVLAVSLLLLPAYRLDTLALVAVYAVAALAQNLLAGYADVPALGNVAFFAAGAYTSAALAGVAGLNPLGAFLLGAAAAGAAGFAVGLPALRISGMHLAIISVVLVFVSRELMDGWDQEHGLGGVTVNGPGWILTEPGLYVAAVLAAILCYVAVWNLLRGRTGRAIRGSADSVTAARSLGIDTVRYLLAAFVLSGALTGVAGATYVFYAHTVTPGAFPLDLSLAFLTMMILGGARSLGGSLVGALIIGLLPQALRALPAEVLGIQVRQSTYAIYALLLLLSVRYLPGGIWNTLAETVEERGSGRA
jgi:branched-chain amino acid transport system permease protein